ncbi:restriction endonuclease subunit S [Exiguobacterium sp. s150]|uniref:restriction endonuclease subunit S n=1 Tax=Exiguobacterium sp. s150 TaxID=2751221 RepID=UPI001BEB640C|nr:restriction endonuclease subunit S [Exiguobacterium sp. s150]
MKTYEEYKSSEIEWIGEIPTDWDVKKIKWMTSIKRGASPRPIDDPKYFDEDGEYAWVRIADVSNAGMYLEQTTQKMSELGASLSVKREPGDIFVSIAGTVGKPCITNIKCCIHDGFVYFPDYKGDKKYFYYIFESGAPYKGLGKMGTQLNLNTETIGSIKIPDIPSNLQTKIGLFIDGKVHEIDTLLDLKQKQIEKLEQQRQSIITEAVTKGLNPNVKMKDSGVEWVNEIPEHWTQKKIKYLVDRVNRNVRDEDEVITAFRDGQVTLRKNRREDGFTFSIKEFGYQGIRKGDLVVHQMDAFAGAIGVSDSDGKASPVYTVCIPKNKKEIHVPFLCEVIRVMSNSGYIESLAKGIRERSTDFRWKDMGELISLVPPISEQIEIENTISRKSQEIKMLIQLIKKNIEKLKEYRQSLIYEAVTGKIDVREMEID